MDSTLLQSQYSTRPEGKLMNITVKTTGMIIMILRCCGSPMAGLSHCCRNMVAPMTRGVM